MILAKVLVIVSGLLLALIYGGNILLIESIVTIKRRFFPGMRSDSTGLCENEEPTGVTVYFSALNEEHVVAERIENIFDSSYPQEKLEVIVVSDGSTDQTVNRVKQYCQCHPYHIVRVIEFTENKGQAHAQNTVATEAKNSVLVSTDAETRFNQSTLTELVRPLADSRVAVVGGIVNYLVQQGSAVGEGYGKYRILEQRLRSLETELGVLVKVDGPCIAYRKSIWEPIEEFEDVDQVITLIARKKGYRAVQAENAICFDRANESTQQEVKQRERMTRKALLSTFNRWGLRESIKFPIFTCLLWFHKLLRFFSPFLTILFIVGFVFLSWGIPLLITLCVITLAMTIRRIRRMAFAYYWAQLGFAKGVFSWLSNDTTGSYKPTKDVV